MGHLHAADQATHAPQTVGIIDRSGAVVEHEVPTRDCPQYHTKRSLKIDVDTLVP